MFCSSKLSRASATLMPILADAVSSETIAQRLIGLDSSRFYNVSLLQGIAEKTSGGVAGNAAEVATAWLSLSSHNPMAAIEGVDKIYSKIQDPAVLRFATGVRLQARNNLLDIKETALSVSGGATESEVSALRAKVMEDLKILKESSPDCWLVRIGHAEFLLYVGKVDEALQELTSIKKQIVDFIEKKQSVSMDIATPDNSNFFALTGLKLRRMEATKNSSVEVKDDVGSPLQELNAHLQLSLSDEEATQLAYVLEAVNAGHHFQEYFPYSGEYDELNTFGASQVKMMVKEFLCPSVKIVEDCELNGIQKPQQAFAGSQDLMKHLSCLPEKSPVAALRAAVGDSAPFHSRFGDAFNNCIDFPPSYETCGGSAFVEARRAMARALAKQMLYRVNVQIGVALTEKQKFHEAVDAISPVIGSKEYIYMWRAYLARSRAHKALGNITESDRDLKALKDLKKSITDRTPYEKC
eukprot:gene832-470_t